MTIDITCPNCNFSKRIAREKIPMGVRWVNCPRCKQRFEFALPQPVFDGKQEQGGTRSESDRGRGSSPWENRSELGVWQGIYRTFKAVLFSPENFFSTMSFKGGVKEPLAFGLLLGSIGTMFEFFLGFLVLFGTLIPLINSFLPEIQFGSTAIIVVFMLIMVLAPLFETITIFITSCLLHLLLLIFSAGKNKFEATFRVVSYSRATKVWSLIPFIGAWIGWFWRLSVHIVGLREIHETSYLRVIIVVLTPLILKILMGVAVLILLIGFSSNTIFR